MYQPHLRRSFGVCKLYMIRRSLLQEPCIGLHPFEVVDILEYKLNNAVIVGSIAELRIIEFK